MTIVVSGPPPGTRGSKLDVAALERRASTLLEMLGLPDSELSIALVDDSEIEALNAEWREKPRPTDVLSFSLVEGEHSDHRAGMLGDVVTSVETAARQAADRHRSLDEVITQLLIHGLLHLIGHDHEEDDEADRMKAEDGRLWQAVRR